MVAPSILLGFAAQHFADRIQALDIIIAHLCAIGQHPIPTPGTTAITEVSNAAEALSEVSPAAWAHCRRHIHANAGPVTMLGAGVAHHVPLGCKLSAAPHAAVSQPVLGSVLFISRAIAHRFYEEQAVYNFVTCGTISEQLPRVWNSALDLAFRTERPNGST